MKLCESDNRRRYQTAPAHTLRMQVDLVLQTVAGFLTIDMLKIEDTRWLGHYAPALLAHDRLPLPDHAP
jgi:hypothetical protein